MKYDSKDYIQVHNWLRRFPKMRICKHCGKTDGKFEWALIKGKQYEKIRDNFTELCISCHRIYDGLIDALAEAKLKPVVAENDKELLRFNSIKEATEALNILPSSISNNLKGRSKMAGGYRWQYV